MVLLSSVIDMYSREPLGHSAVDMADFSVWGGSTAVGPDRLFGRCRTLPTSLWTLIPFLIPCSIYLIYLSLVQCLLGVIHPWVPQDFTPSLATHFLLVFTFFTFLPLPWKFSLDLYFCLSFAAAKPVVTCPVSHPEYTLPTGFLSCVSSSEYTLQVHHTFFIFCALYAGISTMHSSVPLATSAILSPIPVRVNLNNHFMERRAPPFLAQTSLHPIY